MDENIPRITVDALLMQGHDVLDMRGTSDEGIDDNQLWLIAQQTKRLLITTDKGFTRFRNIPHFGLVIVRLRKPNRMKIHEKVMQAFNQTHEENWQGKMMVMQDAIQSVWYSKSE